MQTLPSTLEKAIDILANTIEKIETNKHCREDKENF
jgi:hypothetical protein